MPNDVFKKKNRELSICNLRNNAQVYNEEKKLFEVIMLYCPKILDNPENIERSQLNQYNDLVRKSEVPLPRKKLYFLIS